MHRYSLVRADQDCGSKSTHGKSRPNPRRPQTRREDTGKGVQHRMGKSCSRRIPSTEPRRPDEVGSDSEDSDAWELVEPGPTEAKKRWTRAIYRILLIRKLRRRWSLAGAWLNLYPTGTVDPAVRARVSRLWAQTVPRLLQSLRSKDLFAHLAKRR